MTKIEILNELFDLDWSFGDALVGDFTLEDLLAVVQAIVKDSKAEIEEHGDLLDTLLENFEDDHPIWEHITYG